MMKLLKRFFTGNRNFVELPTVKGYSVYVRKSSVVRIWNDENKTAVMYSSNAIDHIELSLEETLRRLR